MQTEPSSQLPAKAKPKQTHITAEWKHDSPLIACRFDPHGQYVFASAQDNSVQRWNLADGKQVAFRGHDSWVRTIEFSPDGEQVITGGGDGRLVWWSTTADQPSPLRIVDAHQGWIRATAVSADRTRLASGGNDQLIKLWDSSNGTMVGELIGHDKDIYSVLFHPDSKCLLSGDLGGQVNQWNLQTKKLERKFDAEPLHTYNRGQGVDFGGVRTLAVSADEKYLACGGLHKATNPLGAVHEPLVMLYDWQSQKLLQSLVAEGIKGLIWRTLFHAQDFLCGVSGGRDGGFLLFWRADQAKDFHRVKLPQVARDLDMHSDGLQLATAHFDGYLRISRMTEKS